jgi:hypothetical protein
MVDQFRPDAIAGPRLKIVSTLSGLVSRITGGCLEEGGRRLFSTFFAAGVTVIIQCP